MSAVAELMTLPGVIAAGEYAYRGDRFTFEGQLDNEMARLASIMCRATTMSVHMEGDLMAELSSDSGLTPVRGWAVKGPKFSVCVLANVFCFLDPTRGSLNDVLRVMHAELADAPLEMI